MFFVMSLCVVSPGHTFSQKMTIFIHTFVKLHWSAQNINDQIDHQIMCFVGDDLFFF